MLASFMYDSKFDVMFSLGTTVTATFGWGQFTDATTLLTIHTYTLGFLHASECSYY